MITRLGLGLAQAGGLYRTTGEQQAVATIDAAWQRGLRLFDTAPLYGYGLSEQRAGRALAARPRDQFVLSTKVGYVLEPDGPDGQDGWPEGDNVGLTPRFDFSYAGTYRSLEDSLSRLGLHKVDLLHIHDPDHHFEQAVSGSYRALTELRAAGVVGAISVGMCQAPMLERFLREVDGPGFDCVMLAGRYTLLDQSGLDSLLPLCLERGIAVLAAGVYNSGLLSNPTPGSHYDYAPPSQAMLTRALALRDVCERHGVPLRAAALQFPLTHPAVTAVIVGARSPEQVDDNIVMFDHPIPDGLWTDLRRRGLL
ncbi:aldo/keto reductase [Nonomuraea sp. NPDC000554]|uniref:aldo/keto reductase n=1 Tax=Nonomuraea sp. NPDC000554 TaxID=3154259 RepID=UPI00331C96B4